MRLLEIKSPGEFSLVQVATHNTLPYAILSHTWTHGQEVTYQDLISGVAKSKSGYEKIKFCGEQATKDGLRYFWVDTCCIDKTNSTELSTAINSMFRWYRNAKKCYVYLADVSVPDVLANKSLWEAAFRGSKWFTRGWTLQELVAPATVEFFSREGKRLGDKQSLEQPIHRITSIPIRALQGNIFSDFTIAERREWAVRRETTEQEDMAYCLLGLCEVSMPLLYGEGKEAALKRLQITTKEFSKDSSKPKVLEENAPFIVPFDRNLNFTGRGIQLAEAEKKLFKGRQTTKVAIWGLGGIGKTQLVLELVYRIRDKYKKCSVIWILATNMESLHQSYVDIAQKLRIPGLENDEADIKRLVQSYLSEKSAGQWLLVFDNADDIDMWSGQSEAALIKYLPRSEQGCIVFTTRDRKTAVKLANQNVLRVPEMNEDEAIQLLQNRLVDSSLANNKQTSSTLLKELTHLPLAITQATAYINENGISLTKYLSLLADQEDNVVDLLSEEFEDDGRYHNGKNPVVTTWLVSFEQIRHHNPLAAQYLSFIACVEPKDIPQSLLLAGVSNKEETDAVGMLDAYSFIIKRAADHLAFDLHRLVHLATRNWLRKEELIVLWTEKVILRLNELLPSDDYKNRSLWRTYLPHARFVLQSNIIDKHNKERICLAQKLGSCLYKDGRFHESEILFAEVLVSHRRVVGLENLDTIRSMDSLGTALKSQGKYNEAESIFQQTLQLRKKVLGNDHPETLISIARIASTYRDRGRWKEAEELEELVADTTKRLLGVEHPNTLVSMGNLALTYSKQGRWKEAEELELLVMDANKRVLGAEHPDTLISINNLASTYWNQGRWKEAQELEVLVVDTRKRVLGVEHPDTLVSINNLATTYRDQGRWKEAEELDVLVVDARKRVLGAEHPETLLSINNLALTYRDQGRWKEAEELGVLVVDTKKRVLGAEHPDTLVSISNLASTYLNQGRWKEAEELEVPVVDIRKRVLGVEHPDTLISMGNLATTYRNQRRWQEAEELEVLVANTKKRVLGVEHPETLISMGNLATTYRDQGRWKEAGELGLLVVDTRKRVLGVEHPNTLTSMNNLAIVWKEQGRANEAITLMEECVRLRKRCLGIDHPYTRSSIDALNQWQEK